MEGEKICANHICDQELRFEIYTELTQLNDKNVPNNLIKKWSEELNRHFSKKTLKWPTDK